MFIYCIHNLWTRFEDKKFEVIHNAVENVKKIDKTDVRSKKGVI